MPDSPSSDFPPPYTLPVYTSKKRVDSVLSSFDFELEKGLPLPSIPLSPLVSPTDSDYATAGSHSDLSPAPTVTEHGHRRPDVPQDTDAHQSDSDFEDDAESEVCIHISDEHPASTPPTPTSQPERTPSAPGNSVGTLAPPAYHRPFSPPIAWPAPALTVPQRKGSAGSISILVHTETRTF